MAIFQVNHLITPVFFFHLFQKRTFEDTWHKIFMGRLSFLSPNQHAVKPLGETESSDPNQWLDLNISLSITRLMMELAMLPLDWLSDLVQNAF